MIVTEIGSGVYPQPLAAGTEAALTPEAQLRLDGLQDRLHQLQRQEALELAATGGEPSEREAVTPEELPAAAAAQGSGEGSDGDEEAPGKEESREASIAGAGRQLYGSNHKHTHVVHTRVWSQSA